MSTDIVAASPNQSNFVTTLARGFILLSAGMLAALALASLVAGRDIPASASLYTDGPGLRRFYFAHTSAVLAVMSGVWVATLVSAIGVLKRRNWARVLLVVLLTGYLVYVTAILVMTLLFPLPLRIAVSPGFQAMSWPGTLAVGWLGSVAIVGWMVRTLLSPAVRAEFSS